MHYQQATINNVNNKSSRNSDTFLTRSQIADIKISRTQKHAIMFDPMKDAI